MHLCEPGVCPAFYEGCPLMNPNVALIMKLSSLVGWETSRPVLYLLDQEDLVGMTSVS